MNDKIKAFCGRICGGSCGVLITLSQGRIVKIEGDPDCPINQGTLCPKGLAFPELIYHPDRLQHPIKRIGNKGEGRWQQMGTHQQIEAIRHQNGDKCNSNRDNLERC